MDWQKSSTLNQDVDFAPLHPALPSCYQLALQRHVAQADIFQPPGFAGISAKALAALKKKAGTTKKDKAYRRQRQAKSMQIIGAENQASVVMQNIGILPFMLSFS